MTTKKKPSSYSPNRGGYKKREPLKLKSVNELPVSNKKLNLVPVPSGIKEALQAKLSLFKHIESDFDGHFTVSINVHNNTWILEVRGTDPLINYHNGYEVKYIPSSKLVRHPNYRKL